VVIRDKDRYEPVVFGENKELLRLYIWSADKSRSALPSNLRWHPVEQVDQMSARDE
jgi:hypothetical protein